MGMVKRNFQKLDESDFLILHKTYTSDHMWSTLYKHGLLYLQEDIQILEKVQRAATKIVPHLKTRSYEDRLSQLSLITLETRRCRGRENLDKDLFF